MFRQVVFIRVSVQQTDSELDRKTFSREDKTERMHTNRRPALRYAHEGQHGHGAASTDPDSEEDN